MAAIVHQRTVSESTESVDSILMSGVPQGSVLGPTWHYTYTKPIGDIVAGTDIQYHCCYVANTQIYVTIERDEPIVAAPTKVELCIAEVAAWFTKNQLKLNREKSEAIFFFPANQRDSLPTGVHITVAGHRIQPLSCARNLVVLFDIT